MKEVKALKEGGLPRAVALWGFQPQRKSDGSRRPQHARHLRQNGSEGTSIEERRAGAVPPTDNEQMEKHPFLRKICKKSQNFSFLCKNVYDYKHS
jgi:hypothetical protein